jgi:hypothetical protein
MGHVASLTTSMTTPAANAAPDAKLSPYVGRFGSQPAPSVSGPMVRFPHETGHRRRSRLGRACARLASVRPFLEPPVLPQPFAGAGADPGF